MESLVVIHHCDISASANMAASRGTQSMREIGRSRILEPYITKRRDCVCVGGWFADGIHPPSVRSSMISLQAQSKFFYILFFLILKRISKDRTSLSPGSYMETLKSDKIQISGCFPKIAESFLEDKSEKGNIEALI